MQFHELWLARLAHREHVDALERRAPSRGARSAHAAGGDRRSGAAPILITSVLIGRWLRGRPTVREGG